MATSHFFSRSAKRDHPAAGPSLVDQAIALYESGKAGEAESLMRRAIEAEPRDRRGPHLLAVLCRLRGAHAESCQWLDRAMTLEPDCGQLQLELGNTLREMGEPDRAIAAYERALELEPDLSAALTNLAATLQQSGRLDEALPRTIAAANKSPQCAIAQYNLATLHSAMAHPVAAVDAFRAAIAINPNYAAAHWNLAVALLHLGNYAEGWREFEWREAAGEAQFDSFSQPRWQGEALAGKRLLVHAEQGIGDEILFAACFHDVIARASHVTITCEPRLGALWQRSFPEATIVPWQRKKDWSPAPLPTDVDLQIPAGALPLYLRRSPADFPRMEQFLLPDTARVQFWKARFAELGPGLKIGISWRAGGKRDQRRLRSVPLSDWQELFQTAETHFINLQYGDCSAELAAQRATGKPLHDWPSADPLCDLDDYAAKIAALDLVISVGNATVHMAGAVGTPTWALLPQVPSWRWLITGEETPWYRHVHLFRQTRRDDWAGVLERVGNRLSALVGTSPKVGRKPRPETTNVHSQTVPTSGLPMASDDDVKRALAVAIETHQRNDFARAEMIYREILQLAPRYPDALHLLGVVGRQTGRLEMALGSLRRAIAASPEVATYRYSLGCALLDARALAEAIENFTAAVQLDPRLREAWMNLGVAHQYARDHKRALECFEQSLSLEPACADSHLNMGNSLKYLGKPDDARRAFERAIALRPNFAKVHNGLGAALLDERKFTEAVHSFQRAIEIEPNGAPAYNNLGTALRELGKTADAIEAFQRATQLDPRCFEAHASLGCALAAKFHFAEATESYRRALELRPDCVDTLNNYGMALRDLGQFSEALAAFDRAIAIWPHFAMAHANRALVLLQTGKFCEGWKAYRWRWKCDGGELPRARLPQAEWDGSPLAGKTLLVHGEQGLGDEIMFATCYPDLIAQAKHCVIACDERLRTLFARSFPKATTIGLRRTTEHLWTGPRHPHIDFQVAAGDVLAFLRAEQVHFPRRERLLIADPARVDSLRARLEALGPGLKIGFAWRGGAKDEDRRLRWTKLSDWHSVLRVPGVHYVNLQYDDCREELDDLRRSEGITIHRCDEVDLVHDLEGLAALIASLDLVISVGNAGVHMAGALGTPAWSLLPKYRGWRWIEGRSETPWYRSVRLFRQEQPDEWAAPIACMQAELLKLLVPQADARTRRVVPRPRGLWAGPANTLRMVHDRSASR